MSFNQYKTTTTALVLMLLSLWTTGCQQTGRTTREHNAVFDFGQRPRSYDFLGADNNLPQPAANLLGSNGSATRNRTPLSGFLAGSGSNGQANNGGIVQANSPEQFDQLSQMAQQVDQLNQRLSASDSDNQLLNTEVAGLRQKLELANQYNQSLKEQLADTSGRIQQNQLERNNAVAQLEQMQARLQQQGTAPAQGGGGSSNRFASLNGANGQGQNQFASATIRANNSLMRRLSEIQIPGGQARMDGDVIRIEFPSDRIFVPGTFNIAPAQRPVLSNIVETIQRSFPKQIVGIEAHWDNTPLNPPGSTAHQLTATQALAVFEQLTRLGLPQRQLFTMAMASNRPRHPAGFVGGISPNRRIELVIYPETYDGS